MLNTPKTSRIPPEAVVPWAHRRSHLEILASAAKTNQREPLQAFPLGDAFAFTLALTAVDGMVPMKSEHKAELGLDDAGAMRLALRNAAPHFHGAKMANGVAIFQTAHGMAGGGLVLLSALVAHLPLKGAPVAMLPEENLLLVAGADDVEALTLMLDLAEGAYADSDEYRSLRAVTIADGAQLVDWLPPAAHALYARFKSAAARTRIREISTAHAVLLEGTPPLAPLAVVDNALVAAWPRGACVALSQQAEHVMLVDSEDSVVSVPTEKLLAVMKHALEPMLVNGEAAFWRSTGFPSPEQMQALGAARVERAPVVVDTENPIAAQLFPILRAPGYAAAARASMAGIVAGGFGAMRIASTPQRAAFPVGEGVEVEVVRDAGSEMHTLPAELAARPEEARNSALLNLRAASVDAWRVVAPGAFEAPWRDGYTASRMLLPSLAASLALHGETLYFAPTVSRLWVAGSEDHAAIGAVLDEVEALLASGDTVSPYEWRELLFGRPWVRRDGQLMLWQPSAHAERMARIDDALAQRRARAAERAYPLGMSAARPMRAGDA